MSDDAQRVPWLRRPVATARSTAKFTAAAISVVATAVALLFTLWPALRPEGPPVEKGGKIEVQRVEEPVTFRQYLQRAELAATGRSRTELDRTGAYVEYDVTFNGYKGAKLPLRTVLYDAASGDLVSQSKAVVFKPLADEDHASWRDWLPVARPGSYYVTLELDDPSGRVPIARGRSAVFRSEGR